MVERYRPNRRDDDGDRRGARDEDRGRDSVSSKSSGGKWRYEPQRAEDIHARANRTGGRFDSIFKSGIDTWRPKAGDNVIRFLPGTWGLGVHYAFDIWTHRYIGADDSTYLCLDKMLGKFCPICEAAGEAKRAKDEDEAKALRAVEQRAAWILDRDGDNKLSPLQFVMSWTMDRDILSLTEDKRRNKQLWIDNPTDGYDVTIKRSGTGLNTRYFGMAIDRDPSPIADKERDADKIMDFIGENSIPDILNYYDADYIERVLSGTSGPREDEPARGRDRDDRDRDDRRAADPEPDTRRGREPEPEPEPEPRRGRGRAAPEPEPEARRGRDPEPAEPRRSRGREPEPEPEPETRGRRAARDEAKDEQDEDRSGRDRNEPDDAPSRRGGRSEPEDRRSARSNGRGGDDDPPFDKDEDSRPRRASRDETESRGRGRPADDEDRRPPRRR